jgi:hypothetical protein
MLGAIIGLIGGGAKRITLSETDVYGSTAAPGTAVSDYISVTTANLVAPINFNWTRISGSTAISVSNPANPTVRFFGYMTSGAISGVWKCTVTDGAGFSQDTPNVNVNFEDLNV